MTRSAWPSRTWPTGASTAVVCDTPIAAQFALQNENYKGKFKIVGQPFTEEYYGVVVKKGNSKVLEAAQQGASAVRS